MADTFLITDLELTKNSPLGGNIDIDKYRHIIKEVQTFTIEVILGTKLYKKILSDFNSDSLTGVYSTIHENYLIPIIIHSVAAEYIEMQGVVVDNGGIFKRTPENTTPASSSELATLSAKQRSKADIYIDRLQNYLCDQDSNIPEYTFTQDNDYDIDPDKDLNTYGGWRLSRTWSGKTNAEREIWRDIWMDEGKA